MRLKDGRAASAAALLIGACATADVKLAAGEPQDIEFLRGCWVMKAESGGETLAFLRLLPRSADAATYDGQVQVVGGSNPGPRTHFSFARDGTSVVRSAAGDTIWASGPYLGLKAPLGDPPYTRQAHFTFMDEPFSRIAVSSRVEPGRTDTLNVEVWEMRELRNGASDERSREEFRGERDGCD